jgi:hypothetical protein
MVQSTIPLRQALNEMEKTGDMKRPVPFSIKWVTANRSKQTGGQVKEAKGVTLLRNERALPQAKRAASTRKERNRNFNATRDIFYDGREDCVHIYLIVEFNGKAVTS